jgi:molybdopterin converting factor small subunit
MAKMTVKLYTTLRDKIGASRVDVDAGTAADAIRVLRERHPAAEGTLIGDDGFVKNHFTLTLNSRILDPKKLEGVAVNDGDLLHIFPPIAGGGLRPFARLTARAGGCLSAGPIRYSPLAIRAVSPS